jgi:TPR repeat protein
MNSFLHHLRAAAEGGEASAQFNLGVMYDNGLDDNGHDADRDRREAIKWLRKAAQQGLARAQAKLADIYAEQSDMKQAYAWFLVAAESSDGASGQRIQDKMERMARKLTEEEVERANKLARRWATDIRRLASSAVG